MHKSLFYKARGEKEAEKDSILTGGLFGCGFTHGWLLSAWLCTCLCHCMLHLVWVAVYGVVYLVDSLFVDAAGEKFAEEAVEMQEDSWEAHKWFAVLTGSGARFVGTNEKIQRGHKYKVSTRNTLHFTWYDASFLQLCYHLTQNLFGNVWNDSLLPKLIWLDHHSLWEMHHLKSWFM